MEQITLEKVNEKLIQLSERFEKLEEDLLIAKRAEEAYERHKNGDFIKKSKEDFLKELDKW